MRKGVGGRVLVSSSLQISPATPEHSGRQAPLHKTSISMYWKNSHHQKERFLEWQSLAVLLCNHYKFGSENQFVISKGCDLWYIITKSDAQILHL